MADSKASGRAVDPDTESESEEINFGEAIYLTGNRLHSKRRVERRMPVFYPGRFTARRAGVKGQSL
jgi:hypothetical protein